jgi:hypothetical protein
MTADLVVPDPETYLSYKSRNGTSTSRLATQGTHSMNSTEQALMARIVELESRLAVRDNELQDWRRCVPLFIFSPMYVIVFLSLIPLRSFPFRQFDKNAQALLIQLREVRELKSEVLDWWRRARLT